MYSVRPGRASTGVQSKLTRIACSSGGPLRASSEPQEETTTHSGRFGNALTGLKRGLTGNYQVSRVIRAGLNGPPEGLKQASRAREARSTAYTMQFGPSPPILRPTRLGTL